MAGKTKAELEAEIKELKNKTATDLHGLLDAAIDHLNKNSFILRGVNSKGIATLVRSAREKLRVATKR